MQEQLKPGFYDINPKLLKPHPFNPKLYGENEDLSDLLELIPIYGINTRLIVNINGEIVSGNRRNQAALILGLPTVPISVRAFQSRAEELELLLIDNATRTKTVFQKVREGELWKDIEEEKASVRRKAAQNNETGRAVQENFPELGAKGQSRDAIAKRVGLGSGRNYSKALKVAQFIERLNEENKTELALGLEKVLNRSVDGAHKLLKYPARDRERILLIIATDVTLTIKEAQKLLKDFNKPDAKLQPFEIGMQVIVKENAANYGGEMGVISSLPSRDKALVIFEGDRTEILPCSLLEPFVEKPKQQKTRNQQAESTSTDINTETSKTKSKKELTSVEQQMNKKQEQLGLGKKIKDNVLPESEQLNELQHGIETDINELDFVPVPNPEEINPNSVLTNFISLLDYMGADQIKTINRAVAKRKKYLVKDAAFGLADTEDEAIEIVKAIANKYPNAVRQAINDL